MKGKISIILDNEMSNGEDLFWTIKYQRSFNEQVFNGEIADNEITCYEAYQEFMNLIHIKI